MRKFLFFTASFLLAFAGNAQTGIAANNDTVTIHQNTTTTIFVTENDIDSINALTVTILQSTVNGTTTVANSNQVVYAPTQGFTGTDSFTYRVCDTLNHCADATVYITVSADNHPPQARDDDYTLNDTIFVAELAVLNNDNDDEGDSIHITALIPLDTSAGLGAVTIDSSATALLFVRNGTACGVARYEYVVCDYEKCDTGAVSITFICPDKIFLPEGFSPNGDGKNDKLVFTQLEYFSPASLRVFNRYGTTVYENSDYKNDWEGLEMDSNKPLPDGTYYYVLQLPNKHSYNNFIVINR